jgi:hypothetical protein
MHLDVARWPNRKTRESEQADYFNEILVRLAGALKHGNAFV